MSDTEQFFTDLEADWTTVTTEVLRTVWRPGQAPSFDWDEAGWLEVNIP